MNDPTTSPRVWLITGCSSGLGAAIAAAVLARGERVVATARSADALSELAVESDTPPLRLILGKYANDKTRRKLTDAERERAAWEHVGAPTVFAPAQ
jgi:NADP-dependent 3-hydroxy acid dehydrogenase YdfG